MNIIQIWWEKFIYFFMCFNLNRKPKYIQCEDEDNNEDKDKGYTEFGLIDFETPNYNFIIKQ